MSVSNVLILSIVNPDVVGGKNSSRASYLFLLFALFVVVLRKLFPLVNSMSTKGNMTFLLASGYGAHLFTSCAARDH